MFKENAKILLFNKQGKIIKVLKQNILCKLKKIFILKILII